MTIKSDLIAARKLIEKEENWCQGYSKRAASNGGYAYCAAGAISSATAPSYAGNTAAYNHIWPYNSGGVLSGFNDTHTHAEVLALFDRAIAAAGDA